MNMKFKAMDAHIPAVAAKTMIDRYLNGNFHLNTEDGRVLKGLTISRSEIESIFENFQNQNIQELHIMIAIDKNPQTNVEFFTTILGGMDANRNLQTNNLYNYCQPCPDHCPQAW